MTPVTDKDVMDMVRDILDEVITLSDYGSVGINYYNGQVTKCYKELTEEALIGKVHVGDTYKGHLLMIEPTSYDCEYEVVNRGKI